jgi:hypothetical protein
MALPALAERALRALPPEQRAPEALLSILLDPEQLQRLIMVAGFESDAMFPTARAAWLCPARQVTDVTFYLPRGWNCVSTYVTISANYYHPDLIVYVYADEQPVTPWGVTLMSETKISYGSYFVKRRSVRIRTVNNTDVDVYVSELCYGVMLTDRLLNEFYLPLLHYARDALMEAVKRLRPVPLPAR